MSEMQGFEFTDYSVDFETPEGWQESSRCPVATLKDAETLTREYTRDGYRTRILAVQHTGTVVSVHEAEPE